MLGGLGFPLGKMPLLVGLIDELISSLASFARGRAQECTTHCSSGSAERPKRWPALSNALREAIEKVGRCQRCRNLTELEICTDERRDRSLLCVVESPADVLAIDFGGFKGTYFVLNGCLSPIEGIGPMN